MYKYSDDSDSKDSDAGIRFKTVSTRDRGDSSSPEMRKKRKSNSRSRSPHEKNPDNSNKTKNDSNVYGPLLPPSLASNNKIIGPALPPHLLKNIITQNNDLDKMEGSKDSGSCIGPDLPAQLKSSNKNSLKKESMEASPRTIGCSLPPHLSKLSDENKLNNENSTSDDEGEGVYGPLPPGQAASSKTHLALEERALQIKIDQMKTNENEVLSREEWMIELPAVKAASLGLGPRQFRSKAGPDLSDRSTWTDIAGKSKTKEKKSGEADLKQEAEMMETEKRDKEQGDISRKHRSKNKKSLLDIHQEKLKKKQKDEDKSSNERRPFNRDTDLQVNRFDEAQKRAVLKKAQLLDDRFSSGQAKFL